MGRRASTVGNRGGTCKGSSTAKSFSRFRPRTSGSILCRVARGSRHLAPRPERAPRIVCWMRWKRNKRRI
eukprot:43318-Pyramimonas_sp.AAC.1